MINKNRKLTAKQLDACIDYALGCCNRADMNIINALHAGGPKYQVSTDVAIKRIGTDRSPPAADGGDDDDDGDGDGDPDSDRTLRTLQHTRNAVKTHHTAPDRRISATTSRILRMAQIVTKITLCRATIYKYINAGTFPPSIALGIRARGWLESDIDDWIISRINATQAAG